MFSHDIPWYSLHSFRLRLCPNPHSEWSLLQAGGPGTRVIHKVTVVIMVTVIVLKGLGCSIYPAPPNLKSPNLQALNPPAGDDCKKAKP